MEFKAGHQFELPGLETGAILTVCHVDWEPEGVIVHVRLDGVQLPSSYAPGGYVTCVNHVPFSEEALHQSVGQCLTENAPVHDWQDAYDDWREAYELGEATVWSLPVYDALQVMQSLLAG